MGLSLGLALVPASVALRPLFADVACERAEVAESGGQGRHGESCEGAWSACERHSGR